MSACGAKMEVYSRVCGYMRPISNWNLGKKEEFKDRKVFSWRKGVLCAKAPCCMQVAGNMNA